MKACQKLKSVWMFDKNITSLNFVLSTVPPPLKDLRWHQMSYHLTIHHQDGHLSVGRPLNLLPHHRVHLHDLIRQPVVVQEGSHLAAKRAGLVLVQGQLQTASWSLEGGSRGKESTMRLSMWTLKSCHPQLGKGLLKRMQAYFSVHLLYCLWIWKN